MLPKMALRGRASPTAASGARVPDMDALRQMAHDDDRKSSCLTCNIFWGAGLS